MTSAVELAAQLVRIATVTGDEAEGVAQIAALLRDRGWIRVDVIGEANLVASNGGEPAQALLAYADTPPAGRMTEPFVGQLSREDGGAVLRGRGAVTKAGLAAAILAAEHAAQRGPVLLAGTSRDNEGLDAVLPRLGGVRTAVQLEPTDLAIAVAARGIAWLELMLSGEPGHAGAPATAIEPIGDLARAILAIGAAPLPTHARLPAATIVPVELHVEREAPRTASSATATFDRRLLPGEDAEDVRRRIAELVGPAVRSNASVRIVSGMAPYEVDDHAPIVTRLAAAVAAVARGRAVMGVIPFATNAGRARAAGIDAVAFGPGRIADLGDDEHVAVGQIDATVRILGDFLAGS